MTDAFIIRHRGLVDLQIVSGIFGRGFIGGYDRSNADAYQIAATLGHGAWSEFHVTEVD
jgi:hypothetical protein